MYVKTKERSGRTIYFLCIPESGGYSAGWKSVEHLVSLGETLDLTAKRWEEILRGSPMFRSVPLDSVLEVLEKYLAEHRLPSQLLNGLREAAHASKWRKAKRNSYSDRRSQEDERTRALDLLGLPPGSSETQIEKAFRKAARKLHPDVGGDPEKFRAILDARNYLLGRSVRSGEIA